MRPKGAGRRGGYQVGKRDRGEGDRPGFRAAKRQKFWGYPSIALAGRNRNRFLGPRPRACGSGSADNGGRADTRIPTRPSIATAQPAAAASATRDRAELGLSGRVSMATAQSAPDQCGPARAAPCRPAKGMVTRGAETPIGGSVELGAVGA